MTLNKNLAKLFNVEPTNSTQSKSIVGGTFDSGNFEKDYKLVQDNLKELIQNGNVALESILKVATESDNPRAFEVVAILLKTMADLNNNVLSVHKTAKDVTSVQPAKVTQTNNAVFVGSTKDLQNLLNKERSTEKVIDVEVVDDRNKQE